MKHGFNFQSGGPVSELGLSWDPDNDHLVFTAPSAAKNFLPITKRTALAEMARIFDPASWIAPLSVAARMMIQDMWAENFDWDQPLPISHANKWISLRKNLQGIEQIAIPRWIAMNNEC